MLKQLDSSRLVRFDRGGLPLAGLHQRATKYLLDHFVERAARVNNSRCGTPQHRLESPRVVEDALEFAGTLAVGVVGSPCEAIDHHGYRCAEQQDVVELLV